MNVTIQNIDLVHFETLLKETEKIVLKEYGVEMNDFKNNIKKKSLEYAHSRQLVMYIMKNHTAASFSRIGSIYGKNHSTTINAVRMVNNRIETEKGFTDILNRVYVALAPMASLSRSFKFICEKCTSSEIVIKVDYNPNTLKILEKVQDDNYPGFCMKCGEVTIIKTDKYDE